MQHTAEQRIYYTLRLAMGMCFIGHGAFGIITKPIWCHYFAVMGIGEHMAYQLMPPVGVVDILLGLSILIYPVRGVVLWLFGWGLLTALLRPLSGEPIAEFIERGGNYGAPVTMLLLCTFGNNLFQKPFALIKAPSADAQVNLQRTTMCLRIVVFLLLAGHGWLNLVEKKSLIDQYTSIGATQPTALAWMAGGFEILAAFLVLFRPLPKVLLFLFMWKVATELLYPHYGLFEWVERGGSYGSILALYFAVRSSSPRESGDAGIRVSKKVSESYRTT